MSLDIERYYPLVWSVVAATLAGVLSGDNPTVPAGLLYAVMVSSVAMYGFLLAAKAFLVLIDDTEVIRRLKPYGNYDGIVTYIQGAKGALTFLVIFSLLGLVWGEGSKLYLVAFTYFAVLGALVTHRITGILSSMLRYMASRHRRA